MSKSEHERLSAYKYDPNKLTIVGVDTEVTPELRHLHDPHSEKPSQEYIADVAENGIHTPIRVTGTGDALYVVFGRKRVLAARAAEKLVPGLMVQGTSTELLKLVISENIHRSHLSMAARAELMGQLLEAGATEEEARVTLGVTAQTIKNWKAILSVTPAVRKAINENKIPATAAVKLASLEPAEQKEALAEALQGGKGSTVQAAARATRKQKAKKGKRKKKADEIEGHQAPSKRAWIRLLDTYEGVEDLLGTDGLNVLKVVLGRVGTSKIKGLQGAINEVSGKKAE